MCRGVSGGASRWRKPWLVARAAAAACMRGHVQAQLMCLLCRTVRRLRHRPIHHASPAGCCPGAQHPHPHTCHLLRPSLHGKNANRPFAVQLPSALPDLSQPPPCKRMHMYAHTHPARASHTLTLPLSLTRNMPFSRTYGHRGFGTRAGTITHVHLISLACAAAAGLPHICPVCDQGRHPGPGANTKCPKHKLQKAVAVDLAHCRGQHATRAVLIGNTCCPCKPLLGSVQPSWDRYTGPLKQNPSLKARPPADGDALVLPLLHFHE